MLNKLTTTVPTLSRPPLAPPKIADNYSQNCTNNNPFQTNKILEATANPRQTLCPPHTAPNLQKKWLQIYLHQHPLWMQQVLLLWTHKSILYLLLRRTTLWKFLMDWTIKILLENIKITLMNKWVLLRENNLSI